MNEIIANFLDIVKNKYAKFDGRARRKEYWYFFLVNLVVGIILGIIDGIIGMQILSTIWSLALLVPGIAVAIRRMHDVGKSGWFILIPIYNLILAVTEGERKDNEYGPDPKKNEKLV
ncbi:MAG: DUF805 domain-containing protein [Dysgonomonas sp.]|nr:DUF805 domain-containing protein [Dysgonomonas sp.]